MEMSLSTATTTTTTAAPGKLDSSTAHFWNDRREFRAELTKARRLKLPSSNNGDDHPEVSSCNFNSITKNFQV
jgi:hypothetical protein